MTNIKENNKGNVIANAVKQSHDVTANNKQIASAKKPRNDVPKLRFKEFEGEWEQKRYGDIFSFYTTNSFSRDNLNYESGKVKNIHYGDIHTKFSMLFDIQKEIVPFINEDIDFSRIKDENYCQEGDLVIADASEDYNDVGKTIELINLNNEKTLAGLHTFLARPNKYKMQKGFAGYLVQSWKVRKQVMTIAQGSKVLGIATGRLSKIELDIPKLPEQQKIANFLTAVDTKLQQLTTKKETLAQYKKGVMQQLFSQQLRFKPDNTNETVIARTQDEAISPNETEFPDWEEKRLGEVGEIIGGGTPDTTNSDYWDGDIQWFTPTEVYKRNIDKSKRTITTLGLQKSSARILPKGTILFTSRATIAELSFATEECTTNQGFQSIVVNENNNSEFIYYWIIQHRKEFIRRSQGSTFLEISKNEMKKISLSIPSLKEQQKIATYLSAIDLKIEAVQTQITQTQAFKKGLLQQMFV